MDHKILKKRFLNDKDFRPFINSIVFANYKNISPGEELTFNYPLTALIGKNGTNKSSILHALNGCPDGYSPGEYWFSTDVDPHNEKGGRSEFFYRYMHHSTGNEAEVIKFRTIRDYDPDYWEPTKPKISIGMRPFIKIKDGEEIPEDKEKTRWKVMKKNVLYLDFRAEINAFDKAFYKNINSNESRIYNKDRIRRGSKPLKKAISENLESKIYYTKERIYNNYKFSSKEVDIVNEILESNFEDIQYIEHDFYHSNSFSVYLKKKTHETEYSEAWAGSGESSVVRLVYALEKVDNGSLILLDEPETSLHVSAQENLKEYILNKIAKNYHQVVLSTHSPYLVEELPEQAIKNLYINEIDGKVHIDNSSVSGAAAFYLGRKRKAHQKNAIYVEDRLSKAIVEKALKKIDKAITDQISVEIYNGGESHLLKLAIYEATKSISSSYFLFDGDVKPQEAIPDPSEIPESQNDQLEETIGRIFKQKKLVFPKNSNEPTHEYCRNFLNYSRKHINYLPFDTPEAFIVKSLPDKFPDIGSNPNYKELLNNYAAIEIDQQAADSNVTFAIQQTLLKAIEDNNNSELDKIREFIIQFHEHFSN